VTKITPYNGIPQGTSLSALETLVSLIKLLIKNVKLSQFKIFKKVFSERLK